jgi:hypothetical protein
MRFKISYVYEIEAPSQTDARLKMAAARQEGTDEELFAYVSVRRVDQPGLLAQVKQQLVG